MTSSLVSICVVTFNSSKYILETLESIKTQTYKNIELIISDDCSNDETIEVCQNWITKNSSSFKNTQIITVDHNTGVTDNCNRAVQHAAGEYVKIIGDDLLRPNYIEKCLYYFEQNKNCAVLCTRMDYFFSEEVFKYKQPELKEEFFNKTAKEQFEWIKEYNLPQYPTPSMIYKADVFRKIGLFDGRIPMWEDGPYYFRLAQNNIKVHLLNDSLVEYRLIKSSLSNGVPLSLRKSLALYYMYYKYKQEIKTSFILPVLRYVKYFLGYHFLYKLLFLLGK